jgi:glyoxylase-like metal-dependent hydrolase (beta-lactamase superfamily II)
VFTHLLVYPYQEITIMNEPTLFEPRIVAPDTTSITAYFPLPGLGILPINAFLIQAQEPVLVDTGLAAMGQQFRDQLYRQIEPADIKWIWISHADPDHVGNLKDILNDAPNARIVTSYMGMGKMGLLGIPLDRVYLINPGQSLDVGDRKLLAVTPPTYDAPETCGLFDTKHKTLFSADSFGALMKEPVETAEEIPADAWREGCISWATIDAPWLNKIDQDKFSDSLSEISRLNATTMLSSHLPPAQGINNELFSYLKDATQAPRFVGPDQAALEKMMAA